MFFVLSKILHDHTQPSYVNQTFKKDLKIFYSFPKNSAGSRIYKIGDERSAKMNSLSKVGQRESQNSSAGKVKFAAKEEECGDIGSSCYC